MFYHTHTHTPPPTYPLFLLLVLQRWEAGPPTFGILRRPAVPADVDVPPMAGLRGALSAGNVSIYEYVYPPF